MKHVQTTDEILFQVQELYKPFDILAHKRSAEQRDLEFHGNKSLVFGQIDPKGFSELLSFIKPSCGQTFVDLGSGIGKAVLLAALLYPTLRCIGVERLSSLVDLSHEVYEKGLRQFAFLQNTQTSFFCDDLFDFDLSQADLIWVSATCFDEELMYRLHIKLEEVKLGTKLMCLSKGIDSPHWQLIGRKFYRMDWNSDDEGTIVHSYRRI